MFPRSSLAGTLLVPYVKALMSTPFLSPPPRTVESPEPHAVVSDESGSTTNRVETMVGSAAAAAVRVGGFGGAPPVPGLPQLKSPPEPGMSTPPGPAGHVVRLGGGGPEFAQSWIPAGGGLVTRMLPSTSSQVDGAARTCTDKAARLAAAMPLAITRAGILRAAIRAKS